MKQYIRRFVQFLFFLLIALIAINHSLAENGQALPIVGSMSLHAVCPFGSVAGLYQLVTTGTFVKKVHGASLILLYLVLFLSILFGPVFCGWMCPLGTVQEWLNRLGRKLGIKQKKLPKKIDRVARYFRYGLLVLIMVQTARLGELMFANMDPYYALFNFWTDDFVLRSGIILIIVLITTLFVERAWCKYLCPLGGLLGLTNKLRFIKLKRNELTCVECQLCSKNCPMDINVDKKEVISDIQCISCMQCTSQVICPIPDTVQLQTATSKKRISNNGIGLTILVVMITGIGGAIFTDNFATEVSKVPMTLSDGSAYDPEDIRGSYAFTDIAEVFDIPLDVLGRAYGIPEEEWMTVKNKDLEERYHFEGDEEIGNGSVKMFVALYKDLAYDYKTAGDYIPLQAYLLLKEANRIPMEEGAYIENHTLELPQLKTSEGNTEEVTTSDNIEDEQDEEIKMSGKTTFRQLIIWGIEEGAIEEIIGNPISNKLMPLRDYCSENGIEFSRVKAALQIELDKIIELE